MGANYYVHYNECQCCARYDEMHVGKSGTMVQAHVQQPDQDTPASPIGDIRSWADWRKWLAAVPHTCWNEYHEQLTDEELIDTFERTTLDQRGRQYRWVLEHDSDLSCDWLDEDGFSVCSRWFS